MTMKKARTVRVRLGTDGNLRRVTAARKAGRVVQGRVNRAKLDSRAAFALDSDAPVLTKRELRDLKPVVPDDTPDVAAVRKGLRLSQSAFADLFGIPLATVKTGNKVDEPRMLPLVHICG